MKALADLLPEKLRLYAMLALDPTHPEVQGLQRELKLAGDGYVVMCKGIALFVTLYEARAKPKEQKNAMTCLLCGEQFLLYSRVLIHLRTSVVLQFPF